MALCLVSYWNTSSGDCNRIASKHRSSTSNKGILCLFNNRFGYFEYL